MAVYYNEIDPFKARWLRELIKAGLIAGGEVDERSIADISSDDLRGFTQCHFFAGIGVWSYSLRLAGWNDARPVWTGSCPCPSFSVAGKGAGFNDPRHLWPAWFRLIRECHPPVVFGEQVDAAIRYGWLDLVQHQMEPQGYAVGKAVLSAAGVGAPHIRKRLYFVAESERDQEHQEQQRPAEDERERRADGTGYLDDPESVGRRIQHAANIGQTHAPLNTFTNPGDCSADRRGPFTNGFWRNAEWLYCRDGKWRPTEPGTFPLAHGDSARVGRLRGYGDAICAQVAQAFIEAYIDADRGR